jgi:cell division protein FtsI (penicillin-binding protein 3)
MTSARVVTPRPQVAPGQGVRGIGQRPQGRGQPAPPRAPGQWRTLIIGLLLAVGLVTMLWKAARLQLLLGQDLRALAEGQYLREVPLTAARGRIIDRHDRPLAITVPAQSIFAEPKLIADRAAVAQALAPLLAMPAQVLLSKLDTDASFVWLMRRPSPEVSDAVQALKLRGIGTRREWRRMWPNKELLGAVLGSVDVEGVGRGGIEQAANDHLVAKSTRVHALADNRGDRVALVDGVDLDLLAGDDINLTIDAALQQQVEAVLHATLAEYGAKGAWALVMDAHNAEILAAAQAPQHNPNDPASSVAGAARNRPFAEAFEPGSIFKVATFAAALDAGVVLPSDTIDCENGRYQLGKHTIHDTHPASLLTAREVFAHSSNIGTLKIAQRLGESGLRTALQRYGFGTLPGTGLLEEASGRLPNQARWGDARTATVSFGHGVMVSALQVASLVQAVANDGVRVKPRIIDRVRAAGGGAIVQADADDGQRWMNAATAAKLRDIMVAVAEPGGTGTLAAIPGVRVAGKTGTAEKVDRQTGRYSRSLHVSSFVGFAPADAPRYVAIVVVDEPQSQHTGGMTAAPAWRKIMSHALALDGLVATAGLDSAPSAAIEADANRELDAHPTIVGVDVALAHAEPTATAVINTGKPMVDVRGLGLRQALVLLGAQDIVPTFEGHGVVTGQDPPPGGTVVGGTAVSLQLGAAPWARQP